MYEGINYIQEFLGMLPMILLVTFILFMFPASFAQTCWRVNHKRKVNGKTVIDPMTPGDKVLSILPFGSCVMARKSFYGDAGWVAIPMILSPILIATRLIICVIPKLWNGYAFVATFIMLWIGVLMFHLTYAIVYLDIANMFRFSILYKIFLFLIPEVFVFYMISQLPRQMASMEEVTNDRFAGRSQRA